MEGMELNGQSWHEAVVVVDHAEEALETNFVGGYLKIAHCCNSGFKGRNT